jgi:hypothetical protein
VRRFDFIILYDSLKKNISREKTSALLLLEKCNIRLGKLEVELEERKLQENISKEEDVAASSRA